MWYKEEVLGTQTIEDLIRVMGSLNRTKSSAYGLHKKPEAKKALKCAGIIQGSIDPVHEPLD